MIEIAIDLGFHNLTSSEWAAYMRNRVEACPKRSFADLEAGKTYIYKNGKMSWLISVDKVMPRRTQAVARINGNTQKIFSSAYPGANFSELDTELISLVPIKHEDVVRAAVIQGIDVPPKVRREYPHLFVWVPDRFAQDRVRNTLDETWLKRQHPFCAADVDAQIEEAHQQIAGLQSNRTQAVVANPALSEDYDRYIADYMADIDFYRWLRPHVDVGGVFYVS